MPAGRMLGPPGRRGLEAVVMTTSGVIRPSHDGNDGARATAKRIPKRPVTALQSEGGAPRRSPAAGPRGRDRRRGRRRQRRLPPRRARARRDVLLVERAELTSGSTFHSAGLVGQLRADPTLTRMNMYSVDLYRRLAGRGPSARAGSRAAASSSPRARERLEEIRRQISWARTYGLPLEEISAAEDVAELFPLVDLDGVVGAAVPAVGRAPRPVAARATPSRPGPGRAASGSPPARGCSGSTPTTAGTDGG